MIPLKLLPFFLLLSPKAKKISLPLAMRCKVMQLHYFCIKHFAMTEPLIWEKFQQLPATSREAAAKFIDFLLSEAENVPKRNGDQKQRKGFGSWKGIRLSADFDAPLDDFKI